MSTKSTIKCGKWFHLYEDCGDKIYLDVETAVGRITIPMTEEQAMDLGAQFDTECVYCKSWGADHTIVCRRCATEIRERCLPMRHDRTAATYGKSQYQILRERVIDDFNRAGRSPEAAYKILIDLEADLAKEEL